MIQKPPSVSKQYTSPVLTLLVAALLLLFIAGFYAGEDTLGGGVRMDLYLFHGPTMFALREQPWRQVLADYSSATTPLFHMVESLNPLLGHDLWFRAFNVVVSLITTWLFVVTLRRRFADGVSSHAAALLIGASFLLSPYFRAETYWVSTDLLPVLLMILCAWMLLDMQDDHPRSRSSRSTFLHITLLTALAWAAFYCRQTYLFLPAYALGLLMLYRRRQRWFTILLSLLSLLPALWLFRLWHGLNPPAFQRHQKLSAQGVVAPLSMIFIYAIPFAVEACIWQRVRIIREWQRLRRWLPFAAVGWLLFLAGFHAYRFDRENDGGGVASKLLSRLGTPGAFCFLTCGYLGLLVVAWIMLRSRERSRCFIVLFLLPTFAMSIVYQRYYDPILFVLFYLFMNRHLVRPFVTVRMGLVLIAFNGLLLMSALANNGRTKPVFWPITSQAHPWTGTPLDGKLR